MNFPHSSLRLLLPSSLSHINEVVIEFSSVAHSPEEGHMKVTIRDVTASYVHEHLLLLLQSRTASNTEGNAPAIGLILPFVFIHFTSHVCSRQSFHTYTRHILFFKLRIEKNKVEIKGMSY